MSCYPQCPVPSFILPKKKEKTDCIKRCVGSRCTGYKLYAIQPQTERCINAELAELLRCHACQEERLKRLSDTGRLDYECYMQKLACKYPEIPLAGQPELPHPQHIRHGYVVNDCFPENILKSPCKQKADWKKKVKAWIKTLNAHYNKVVTEPAEQPIEDYIRLNMGHKCLACRGYEDQTIKPDGKCDDKKPIRPRCVMVGVNCGKCMKVKEDKNEAENSKTPCPNLGEIQLTHCGCKLR